MDSQTKSTSFQSVRPCIGGHIGFSNDAVSASGSLQLGSEGMVGNVESVQGSYMRPNYSLNTSTSAGAYVVEDGLTLKWDTSSEEWANATWSENVKFTYWVEDDRR